ncbi:MAG: ABC transporter ATP-binding protein [Eubacteriales bacterium]
MPNKDDKLLIVENVVKYYSANQKILEKKPRDVKAVDNVSFYVKPGETFGIVGESGCGKTTLGKCIVRLHKPTSGSMWVRDEGGMKDLLALNNKESFKFRQKIQIVFQDPYASLNPMHNILESFDEPLRLHGFGTREHRKEIVAEMLETVNLQPDYMYRFPHEFSGGQRQRICIAKALAMKPELIVCDEPVSSLDVSIQAQILNLMRKLQKEYNLAYIFIAHDLSVVQYMSDRIAVMYLGRIVETADAKALYNNCLHPYSKALLSAVPIPVYGQKRDRIILSGDVASPINPPTGCHFHPRCDRCMEICKSVEPQLIDSGDGHMVACHLYSK